MSKDEAKDELRYSLNCLVNIKYKRYRNVECKFNGVVKIERRCYDWNHTGMIEKVRKGSVLIKVNDERTLSLGYRNMVLIKYLAGRNILKERYLMNKI